MSAKSAAVSRTIAEPRPQTLGVRLRALRAAAGFSLEVLAAKAGVSTGMISQIERGTANPSLRILECLRVGLDVPLTTLLEDDPQPANRTPVPTSATGTASVPNASNASTTSAFVRRSDNRPRFSVSEGGLWKELLSVQGDHDIQFMIIHVPPGAASDEVIIGPGEKAGLLIEGALELTLDGQTAMLTEGDSFQFSSELPHGVRNLGAKEATVLWIMNTSLRRRLL